MEEAAAGLRSIREDQAAILRSGDRAREESERMAELWGAEAAIWRRVSVSPIDVLADDVAWLVRIAALAAECDAEGRADRWRRVASD